MKLNSRQTNKSEEIAEQALSLLDNLKLTGISIEIDEDTGISLVHEMGAFGASPDMPKEIARMYLADQVGSVIDSSRGSGF